MINTVIVGVVVQGGGGEPERIIERHIIREDGTMELIFMAEERKKEMQDKKELANYLNQFHVIEGVSKAEFFEKNNLTPKEKVL